MKHVIISIAVFSGLATSVARAEDVHVAQLLICVGETTDRMVRQLKAAGLTPRGKELEGALVKAGATVAPARYSIQLSKRPMTLLRLKGYSRIPTIGVWLRTKLGRSSVPKA